MAVIRNIRKRCVMLGLTLILSASLFCTPQLEDNLFFTTDGPDVTNYWLFGNQPLHSLWSNSQYGFYGVWSKSWELLDQYGTISFKALPTDGIIFAGISTFNPWDVASSGTDLYLNLIRPHNFYEFIIGPGFSVLFKGGFLEDDHLLKVANSGIPVNPHTGNLITELVEYRIVFYRSNNQDFIALYALNPVTNKWKRLIRYHAPDFRRGPRWFSLTSFYGDTFYEEIEASGATALPVNAPNAAPRSLP